MNAEHDARAVGDLYGILAEFPSAESLMDAARRTGAAGYVRTDAYSPLPIHGLAEALGSRPTKLPYLVLAGGILGGLAGYALQYYTMVIAYPMNVGGRPIHSWPSFIPVTFELTILGAALSAVLGMLALNGLPQPHHPLFNIPEFSLASQNRFFLCIEARDPQFEAEGASRFLHELGATRLWMVDQ